MDSDEDTLKKIANKAEVSPDAIKLIYCVFNHLNAVAKDSEDEGHHLTSDDLCDGLLSLSQQYYGESYVHALQTWGLGTSEKLGRAIVTLAEAGWVRPTEGDEEIDFKGKFDLSTIS
jgi:uncharacterized repeat protein (TIGR04138 family)